MRLGVLRGTAIVVAVMGVLGGTAHADIVYDDGFTIYKANDDGTAPQPLATVVPGAPGVAVANMKTLNFPDVAPNGSKVVFEGDDPVHNNPMAPAACDDNCAGVYAYENGAVTRLTGFMPGPCSHPCSLLESQPEINPAGQIVAGYVWADFEQYCLDAFSCDWEISPSSYDALTRPPHGSPVDGASANDVPTPCSDNDLTSQPEWPALSDDNQFVAYTGCGDGSGHITIMRSDLAGQGQTVCRALAPVNGSNPFTDIAFAHDGRILDGEIGPNNGLWSYPCPAGTSAKQLIAAPATAELQSPRQNGTGRILFDAIQNVGTDQQTSDVWSIPDTCGQAGTPCQFPADATQITHDGAVAGVAWTSQTIPVPPPPPPSTGGGGGGTTPGPTATTPTTTTPTTTTPPSTTPPSTTPPVTLRTPTFDSRHVAVRLPLACGAPKGSSCPLTVTLTVVEHLHGTHVTALSAAHRRTRVRTVVLGHVTVTLAGGTAKSVTVTLNATARKLLRARRRFPVRVRVSESGRTVATRTVVIRRARQHR